MGKEVSKTARFTLQILGGFRLADLAGNEIVLPTKQDRALLGYLALANARPFRDQLAAIIWERRDAEQARHSLSGSLRALRQALGDSDGKIIVPSSDPLECRFDVLEVDALAVRRAAKEHTPDAWRCIETLYAGDLLEGLQ